MTQTEKLKEKMQLALQNAGTLRLVSFIAAATAAKMEPTMAQTSLRKFLDDGVFKVEDIQESLKEHLGIAEI